MTNSTNLLTSIACILFSILPLWLGISSVKEYLSCTQKIEAKFKKFNTKIYSHTQRRIATFEYYFNDLNYICSTLENTSIKEEKTFKKDNTYNIYINPNKPNICKHRKKSIYFTDIFMILFGLILFISSIIFIFV